MQDMHALEAGIQQGGNEYIQKDKAVHTPVAVRERLSTCYPARQSQAPTGLEALFHSFHIPYY